MNIPGIDEGVKQALIKRTTFQTMNNNNNNNGDGLRKRSRTSVSGSNLSIRREDLREKKMSTGSYLLGVPTAGSSQVWRGAGVKSIACSVNMNKQKKE